MGLVLGWCWVNTSGFGLVLDSFWATVALDSLWGTISYLVGRSGLLWGSFGMVLDEVSSTVDFGLILCWCWVSVGLGSGWCRFRFRLVWD